MKLNKSKDLEKTKIKTPFGYVWAIADDQNLHAIQWSEDKIDLKDQEQLKQIKENPNNLIAKETANQLAEYFKGQRKTFKLPLSPAGTEFQRQAWKALQRIPYGKTISYSEQAEKIGSVHKTRAVGVANSKNPISIIIPCHRVIGKNGTLTGFGGGLDLKKFLIEHEAANL